MIVPKLSDWVLSIANRQLPIANFRLDPDWNTDKPAIQNKKSAFGNRQLPIGNRQLAFGNRQLAIDNIGTTMSADSPANYTSAFG